MSPETTLQCVTDTLIHDCVLAANAGRIPEFLRREEMLKPKQAFTVTSQMKQEGEFKISTTFLGRNSGINTRFVSLTVPSLIPLFQQYDPEIPIAIKQLKRWFQLNRQELSHQERTPELQLLSGNKGMAVGFIPIVSQWIIHPTQISG